MAGSGWIIPLAAGARRGRRILLLVWLGLCGAAAAEPVFPPGSAVGIEVPPGFELNGESNGFEHPDTGEQVRIGQALLTPGADPRREMRAAVAALVRHMAATSGFREARRREMTRPDGRPATLVAGRWEAAGESGDAWLYIGLGETIMGTVVASRPGRASPAEQAAFEAMLIGVTLRPPLSIAEQLAALPFSFDTSTRLAARVVTPAAAFLLSEVSEARVILRLRPNPPVAAADRAAAARAALDGGVDVPVLAPRPGPAREATLGGFPAIHLPFEAERQVTRAPMRGALWMGFPPDGRVLMMVELAPAAEFAPAATAFRIIRESLRLR